MRKRFIAINIVVSYLDGCDRHIARSNRRDRDQLTGARRRYVQEVEALLSWNLDLLSPISLRALTHASGCGWRGPRKRRSATSCPRQAAMIVANAARKCCPPWTGSSQLLPRSH